MSWLRRIGGAFAFISALGSLLLVLTIAAVVEWTLRTFSRERADG